MLFRPSFVCFRRSFPKSSFSRLFSSSSSNSFSPTAATSFFPPCSTTHSFPPSSSWKRPLHQQILQKNEELKQIAKQLVEKSPKGTVVPFSFSGNNVEILTEPKDFFQQLCNGIKQAKKRIVLCSLYLGLGPKARHLVDLLNEACAKNPSLEVVILMDYLRGTRPGKEIIRIDNPTFLGAGDPNQTSASQLLPLLRNHPDKVKAAFYHSPDLSGLQRRIVIPPLNELAGVQHMKAYIFDNDVIVSGANLQDHYFTDRLDRYLVFRECDPLSEYFCGLVQVVGKFSYWLGNENVVGEGETRQIGEDGSLSFRSNLSPKVTSHESPKFKRYAKRLVLDFLNEYSSKFCSLPPPSSHDSLGLITVQMAQIGIRHDQEFTKLLLNTLSSPSWQTIITSPYMNFPPSLRDLLLFQLKGRREILVPCPKASGFYWAKGVLTEIPRLYGYLLNKIFLLLKKRGGDAEKKGVTLLEWEKEGWTFHGKGVWWKKESIEELDASPSPISSPSSSSSLPPLSPNPPSIVNVGSSNFGVRSYERDLEAQMTIITENSNLSSQFEREMRELRKRGKIVNEETFKKEDYQVKWWVKAASYIGSIYL